MTHPAPCRAFAERFVVPAMGRSGRYCAGMRDNHAWSGILETLLAGTDLEIGQASWAMEQIVRGEASGAQIGAFAVALRAKGESSGELVGFRDAILANATPLDAPSDVIDIVGTGGDRYGTVNISTTASIVVAATGVPVLKHGNRAVSSASGASDVLGVLGVVPTSDGPALVAEILAQAGISFVWAARFHPGFRHAGPVRADLGIPTVFNLLGPLVNPARPEVTLAGVADRTKIPAIAGMFASRGATAFVVRGEDGLDELTTTGHSALWEVSRGDVLEHDIDPRDLGLPTVSIDTLIGGDPHHNAAVLRSVLQGEHGPVRDIVLLNAAAAIAAWELGHNPDLVREPLVERLAAALSTARAAIDDGRADATLARWRDATASADARAAGEPADARG